jgi:hypothetical protein
MSHQVRRKVLVSEVPSDRLNLRRVRYTDSKLGTMMGRLYESMKTQTSLPICGLAFLSSAVAVFPFLFAPEIEVRLSRIGLITIWIVLSLLVGIVSGTIATFSLQKLRDDLLKYAMPILLSLIGAFRTFGVLGFRDFSQYGDSFAFFVTDNEDIGRWLLGYSVVREVFDAINSFLFTLSASIFTGMAGGLIMMLWGFWIMSRSEHPITKWLVLLSPMWVLFSVGYDEYYPFISGLLVAVCWQILSGLSYFDQRSNYVLVGVMPALYVGAAPISLALLIFAWGKEKDWNRRLKGAVVACIAFAIAVEIGGEFKGYFKNLESWMNLGSGIRSPEGNLDDSLIAVTSSSRSFLATRSYALSPTHLLDIWYWLVCGAGILVLIFAFIVGGRNGSQISSLSSRAKKRSLNFETVSRVVLVTSALIFLIFMLPQLGPTADIDLYFWSIFVLLMTVGLRLDQRVKKTPDENLAVVRTLQVVAFGFAPATTALVIFGVSRY